MNQNPTSLSWIVSILTLAIAIWSTAQAQLETKFLRHDGLLREYHLLLPNDFVAGSPPPLVIALHGMKGEGRNFDDVTQGTLSSAASDRGFVLVFPEGVDQRWNDGSHMSETDDVGFLTKLIDTMIADYGIARDRVYITGKSNGGFMAIRLAIEMSDKVAAIAPVCAQLRHELKSHKPRAPVSIMLVNGTSDRLVPFGGRKRRKIPIRGTVGGILSVEETVDYFRYHNDCKQGIKTKRLPDHDPTDGTRVNIERYMDGKKGSEVILVKVNGGGHTWPGGKQLPSFLGAVSRDINASEMILDFFSRHQR